MFSAIASPLVEMALLVVADDLVRRTVVENQSLYLLDDFLMFRAMASHQSK
jgi:hypothetical protein